MSEQRGPWLIAAIFCDVVGAESGQADDRLYTIRPANFARLSVDRATFSAEESIDVPMYLAIAGGEAGRQYHVRLVTWDPAGKLQRDDDYYVSFPGIPGAAVDTMVQIPLLPVRSGVFWVDVLVDGNQMARVPFRLELQFT